MKETVKADRYTCDGCGDVDLVEPGEELPGGYHGSHMHIHGTGGDGGQWFACSRKCLLNAIDNSER